jgi:TonB-linked SusC/RagA family outer membrane protein
MMDTPAFSRNNKYAFFPSGAFAWNVKEEKFLDDVKWLNQFKIRTSYGLTGNQAIDPYQTLARLSTEIAVIGGQQVTAVRPTSVANDNLTWETTAQFNAGIDLGIFNSRINLSADYYKKTTSDLLFSVPLPQYTGYSTQLQNIGKVENKGYEFTLTTKNMTGLFKWTTDFNISFNKNKILELPGGQDIFYGAVPGHMVGTGSMQVLRVGQPVGMFYGYIYDGVYQEGDAFVPGSGFEEMPGGEKYRDINGRDADSKLTNKPDGQLDEDDKTIIGNPHPKFIWALNNEFKWKGVDLTVFFQASQGNDLYSFTLAELGRNSGGNNATTKEADRWTPSHTNTDVAAVNPGRAFIPSSQWVFDGSYIRLKNIMLGYTLPEHINERIKIRSLRFYISAQNILTFTKYKGYDPEVNYLSGGGPGGNLNLGLDYGSYPNAKSVTFGINVGF